MGSDTARTEAQAAFRRELAAFASAHGSSQAVRALLDHPAGYDPATWDLMIKQLGLPGLIVAEEHGGSGAGWAEAVIALEELGATLLPSPFLPALIATAALQAAASPRAAAGLLPAITDGRQRLILALPHDRQEHSAAVSARESGGQWTVTGRVPCVPDGCGASTLAVVADTSAGPVLLCADGRAPGLARAALETLDLTRRQASITFDATPAVLVSSPGNTGWLPRTRALAALAIAADQLGGIRRCLEMATAYARDRTAFGRAIGSFQAIKHLCADMLVDLECTRAAVEHAARVADDDGTPGSSALTLACSVAKAYASDAYCRAAATLIQVHGGLGFTWEHDAHLYYRRAHSDEQLAGDSAFHRAQIAAALVASA